MSDQTQPTFDTLRAITMEELQAIGNLLADVPLRVGLPIIRLLDTVSTRRIELRPEPAAAPEPEPTAEPDKE